MNMNAPSTHPGADARVPAAVQGGGLLSWDTLRRHWLVLALLPIAGIVASIVYLETARYEWQAQGTIRVGKVGNESIEPPVQVLSRLRLQSFKSRVLDKLGIDQDDDDPGIDLVRDGLQAREVTGSDLIEIRTRGHTPEAAVASLQAAIELLIADHATRAEPLVARIEKRISEVDAELDAARRDRSRQVESVNAQVRTGSNPLLAASAATQMISLRDAEIRDLIQRKFALEDLLKRNITFPTQLIEDVYVPRRPAYPKRSVALLVGLAAGLAISFTVAIVMEWRPERRASVPGGVVPQARRSPPESNTG